MALILHFFMFELIGYDGKEKGNLRRKNVITGEYVSFG